MKGMHKQQVHISTKNNSGKRKLLRKSWAGTFDELGSEEQLSNGQTQSFQIIKPALCSLPDTHVVDDFRIISSGRNSHLQANR